MSFTRSNILKSVSSLVLTKENSCQISSSLALTAANIGLNLVTSYGFGILSTMLFAAPGTTYLGLSLLPFAAVYCGLSWILSYLQTFIGLMMAPVNCNATHAILLQYLQSQMNQSLEHHLSGPDHHFLINKCFMSMPSVSTQLFTQIIPTTIEGIIAISILSKRYGLLPGVSISLMLLCQTIYSAVTARQIVDTRKALTIAGQEGFLKVDGVLKNYVTINLFNNGNHEEKELKKVFDIYTEKETRATSIFSLIALGQITIANLGYYAVFMLSAAFVASGYFTGGDFIFINAYMALFKASLTAFSSAVNQLIAAFIDLKVVLEAIHKPSVIVDRYPNIQLDVRPGTASIELKNVNFSYKKEKKEDEKLIYDNVSFTIKTGQTVGVVGTSGTGKSTLTNLLLRFYEPNSGSILINGRDIQTVSLKSLRSAISVVPQQALLFDATLYTNIAYGRPSASKAEIERACIAAGLSDFIKSLKNGLDTEIGAKGIKVSGGEQQRIAIARAFLKNPSIYIFDEATSALDSEKEEIVQKSINALSKSATSIVITHRLANLIKADNILVLDKGNIVEQGTHRQLIQISNGIYRKLWEKQRVAMLNDSEKKNINITDDKYSELRLSDSKNTLMPSPKNNNKSSVRINPIETVVVKIQP